VLGPGRRSRRPRRGCCVGSSSSSSKTPGFKAESVKAQVDLIKGLVEVVETKSDENDWTKGLVASAKAAGLKRVMTDHPDLADKTEVDGIQFLSTEAWLLEATTPPPPPPPKKK
jgi:hypothetical protein